MSFQAVKFVSHLRGYTGAEKSVLFVLAIHATPTDGLSWPSTALLAKQAGVTGPTVSKALKKARERNVIRRDVAPGDARTNAYRFNLPASLLATWDEGGEE